MPIHFRRETFRWIDGQDVQTNRIGSPFQAVASRSPIDSAAPPKRLPEYGHPTASTLAEHHESDGAIRRQGEVHPGAAVRVGSASRPSIRTSRSAAGTPTQPPPGGLRPARW